MDEKTTDLIESFMNVQIVPRSSVSSKKYTKIPFNDLTAIGAGFASLLQPFRTITENVSLNLDDNVYAAFSADGVPTELQFQFKNSSDYMGSAVINGSTAQTHFQKLGDIISESKTKLPVNPTDLYMMAALVQINKKLDDVKQLQTQLIEFLESDKRSELEGALLFLTDALEKYRYNWTNEQYRANMHLKTQDIKQTAEHNILFYKKRISTAKEKSSTFNSGSSIKKVEKAAKDDFENYRLSLYLYAFSSFLEVMYLCNFSSDYLNSISEKIDAYSLDYMELYSECYTAFEKEHRKSVGSLLETSFASATGTIGRVVEKIPILSKTQLDEKLIGSEESIKQKSANRTTASLSSFSESRSSAVRPFIEMIESMDRIHNNPEPVLFDREGVYIAMPI